MPLCQLLDVQQWLLQQYDHTLVQYSTLQVGNQPVKITIMSLNILFTYNNVKSEMGIRF
jgi:hypothetical protein